MWDALFAYGLSNDHPASQSDAASFALAEDFCLAMLMYVREDVLRGIGEADWRRIEQVVVEAHGAARAAEVRRLLGLHYEAVGEAADEELAACGLERAVVWARGPRGRNT